MECLKIVTWPIVVVVCAFIFRKPISGLIEKIRDLKAPGVGISTCQEATQGLQKSPESLIIETFVKREIEHLNTIQSKDDIIHQLWTERVRWEFDYLNLFLVAKTKTVLRFLAQRIPPITREDYLKAWPQDQQEQRDIVLNVLLDNGLVVDSSGILLVTDKGIAFNQFVSPNGFTNEDRLCVTVFLPGLLGSES